MDKIKVIELFAGVGGFRIGLEGYNNLSPLSRYKEVMNSNYEVIWSNQFEPSTKIQHASIIYENKFKNGNHVNKDINDVDINDIPDFDLLVGGFPCQDYSIASTLKNSKGLLGKKGVLWWNIHKIISEKEIKPKYLLLENVDRLLISPSKQRGRDFSIILQSLNNLGYIVEYRVINAAEYGMPQRRKRTFILAYHNSSPLYEKILKCDNINFIKNESVLAKSHPIDDKIDKLNKFELPIDILDISNNFNANFENTGVMINGMVTTFKSKPKYIGEYMNLGDILDDNIPEEFYISDNDMTKWSYLKGSKKINRISSTGFEYTYSEGAMIFPDSLENASRTIITGEGGGSPSRFKHVILDNNKHRRLTPIELERLNMFPDNHTLLDGISNTKRAFFMGNALVIGIVENIGKELNKQING